MCYNSHDEPRAVGGREFLSLQGRNWKGFPADVISKVGFEVRVGVYQTRVETGRSGRWSSKRQVITKEKGMVCLGMR